MNEKILDQVNKAVEYTSEDGFKEYNDAVEKLKQATDELDRAKKYLDDLKAGYPEYNACIQNQLIMNERVPLEERMRILEENATEEFLKVYFPKHITLKDLKFILEIFNIMGI